MTEYIELGGKLRPVSFAHRQQRFYEEEFKTPFAKDWQVLMSQFAPMMSNANDKEAVIGLAADVSLVLLGNMFYSAFLAGHNLERVSIDFDVYDLTDWISVDTDIVTKLTMMLVSANTTGVKGVSIDDTKKESSEEEGFIDWDERLFLAVKCGMSEPEFWACTSKILYMRSLKIVEDVRLSWEQTRFLGFSMYRTGFKEYKVRKESDILKFPWEQEVPRFVKQSKEQLQAFSNEADEILRITQPEVYKKYMEAKQAQHGGAAT